MENRRPEDFIVNFRDVGHTLEHLAGERVFPTETIYRGGRFHAARSHEELLLIPTIICLRRQKNRRDFEATHLRAAADDNHEVYDTTNKHTLAWLNKALALLSRPQLDLPVYLHCTSGKDRTGVLVAALLLVCHVDEELIVQEYLESEGDVNARSIRSALDGLRDVERALRKVDLDALRERFALRAEG